MRRWYTVKRVSVFTKDNIEKTQNVATFLEGVDAEIWAKSQSSNGAKWMTCGSFYRVELCGSTVAEFENGERRK